MERIPPTTRLSRLLDWCRAQEASDLHPLTGIIEASVAQGMHSFDQYLVELLAAGLISEATARHFAVNKHKSV